MTALLDIALSNMLVAAVIAGVALAAGRLARRPALAHGLWLLFFVKLLTPTLLPIPIALQADAPSPGTAVPGRPIAVAEIPDTSLDESAVLLEELVAEAPNIQRPEALAAEIAPAP